LGSERQRSLSLPESVKSVRKSKTLNRKSGSKRKEKEKDSSSSSSSSTSSSKKNPHVLSDYSQEEILDQKKTQLTNIARRFGRNV
jgi:hypothetical protein